MLTTSFQFGSALGLAVVAAVITETTTTPAQTLDGFRTALFVPLAAAILGLLASAPGLVTRPALEPKHSDRKGPFQPRCVRLIAVGYTSRISSRLERSRVFESLLENHCKHS